MTTTSLRSRPKRSLSSRIATLIGVILLLVGLGCIGYIGWQYFGTNIVSKQKQATIKKELGAAWAGGTDGDAVGLLRIRRFGADYEAPIVPGFDDAALARGVGWYPEQAGPGEIGNFAIAGHRVTHGELFRDFPTLRKGDEVIVETRTKIFTYVLRDNGEDRILDFTTTWPLQAVPEPGKSGVRPTRPVLTMLTCAELFHTRNRNVVFGDLVSTEQK